jgi:sec-independent protein translocase protein TatC
MAHNDVEMTLSDHLEELRKRMIRAILGALIAACVAGVFYKEVMSAVVWPYQAAWVKVVAELEKEDLAEAARLEAAKGAESPEAPAPTGTAPAVTGTAAVHAAISKYPSPRLIMGSPAAGVLSIILVTTVVGIMAASPWVLFQIWSFISVGLREKEHKFIRLYTPVSFLLFAAGGVLCYFVVLPYGLAALMTAALSIKIDGMSVLDPSVILDDYLKFIALMTLVFGITFQTPLVIIFLAKTRLVPLETLARKQKLIIFIMIVLGALLAPTGDPITCTLMAVPLILLYELGLLVAWLMERRDRRLHPEKYAPFD